eukprot:360129-Chlamydomonas_euryale.AAC.6
MFTLSLTQTHHAACDPNFPLAVSPSSSAMIDAAMQSAFCFPICQGSLFSGPAQVLAATRAFGCRKDRESSSEGSLALKQQQERQHLVDQQQQQAQEQRDPLQQPTQQRYIRQHQQAQLWQDQPPLSYQHFQQQAPPRSRVPPSSFASSPERAGPPFERRLADQLPPTTLASNPERAGPVIEPGLADQLPPTSLVSSPERTGPPFEQQLADQLLPDGLASTSEDARLLRVRQVPVQVPRGNHEAGPPLEGRVPTSPAHAAALPPEPHFSHASSVQLGSPVAAPVAAPVDASWAGGGAAAAPRKHESRADGRGVGRGAAFSLEPGNVPLETGNVPLEAGNVPLETGNVPLETGNVPLETGKMPGGNSYPPGGNSYQHSTTGSRGASVRSGSGFLGNSGGGTSVGGSSSGSSNSGVTSERLALAAVLAQAERGAERLQRLKVRCRAESNVPEAEGKDVGPSRTFPPRPGGQGYRAFSAAQGGLRRPGVLAFG